MSLGPPGGSAQSWEPGLMVGSHPDLVLSPSHPSRGPARLLLASNQMPSDRGQQGPGRGSASLAQV